MKVFGSILFIITIVSTGAYHHTYYQLNTVSSDSSKVNSAPVVQTDSLSGALVQNLDLRNQHKNSNIDCMVFRPDSTYPRMKIFVPDNELTDSMPIFKPGLVDPGILIPGGECFQPNRKN